MANFDAARHFQVVINSTSPNHDPTNVRFNEPTRFPETVSSFCSFKKSHASLSSVPALEHKRKGETTNAADDLIVTPAAFESRAPRDSSLIPEPGTYSETRAKQEREGRDVARAAKCDPRSPLFGSDAHVHCVPDRVNESMEVRMMLIRTPPTIPARKTADATNLKRTFPYVSFP